MQENAKVWYKKWWGALLISFITFILVVLIAIGFSIADRVRQIRDQTANGQNIIKEKVKDESQKLAEGDGTNYWIGSANPKITIVEFADYACTYCKKSFSSIREIGIKHKDDVKIIFRDFTIREQYSVDLALAGRCAGEQGLFWPMHDRLFQDQGISTKTEITEAAIKVGVDIDRFGKCMDGQKYLPQIRKDYSDGESLKIAGTPTWFVNGTKIEGDVPLDNWEEIINSFK